MVQLSNVCIRLLFAGRIILGIHVDRASRGLEIKIVCVTGHGEGIGSHTCYLSSVNASCRVHKAHFIPTEPVCVFTSVTR